MTKRTRVMWPWTVVKRWWYWTIKLPDDWLINQLDRGMGIRELALSSYPRRWRWPMPPSKECRYEIIRPERTLANWAEVDSYLTAQGYGPDRRTTPVDLVRLAARLAPLEYESRYDRPHRELTMVDFLKHAGCEVPVTSNGKQTSRIYASSPNALCHSSFDGHLCLIGLSIPRTDPALVAVDALHWFDLAFDTWIGFLVIDR